MSKGVDYVSNLNQYSGETIEIELTSKKVINGKLIEYGSDILVVFNGQKFFYIPFLHIVSIKKCESNDTNFIAAEQSPIKNEDERMSLTKTLNHAKGIFVEIYVTGNQTIYGYITSIQDDYFVFYSPAYKTICISTAHLKWLIPYLNQAPYDLKEGPVIISLDVADTFEEQIKKLEGEVVFFDLGKDPYKIGLIKNVNLKIIELVYGDGQIIHLNLTHIKSVHKANR